MIPITGVGDTDTDCAVPVIMIFNCKGFYLKMH